MVSRVSFRFRRRASLELEVLALRHQVAVLHQQRPGRARLGRGDRLLWAWLYRDWPRCLKVMVPVKPATVLQWHRQGFRKYWRWRSRSRRAGRPEVNREIRELIRQMSVANPLWGAPRIHGEARAPPAGHPGPLRAAAATAPDCQRKTRNHHRRAISVRFVGVSYVRDVAARLLNQTRPLARIRSRTTQDASGDLPVEFAENEISVSFVPFLPCSLIDAAFHADASRTKCVLCGFSE